jgi:hypothetical protein
VADPAAADWTVMVYLDADNDLEPHGFDDVDEMGLVGSSAAVNVVVLLDGLTRDGGRARDLRVTPGGFEVLEELGEVDMSDWRTLRDFGVRTMHRYPARRHALILWDHGAGWKSAGRAVPHKEFAHDESAGGAAMSVSRGDYASALAGIKEALGEKLDVIAFDACLMGTWEVAHASAPYGAYLVASQETMPVTGYDYDGFLRLLVDAPSMDGRELARVLADTTAEDSVDNVTQSVVRLESLWVVDQAVSDLADALLAHPDAHGLVEQARRMAQHFSGDDLRDLRGLADALGVLAGVPADVGTAARTLSAAVGVVVEHNRTQGGYQGAHGLSAYMPARGSGLDQDYTGPGATWSQVTTWDDWLMRFTR